MGMAEDIDDLVSKGEVAAVEKAAAVAERMGRHDIAQAIRALICEEDGHDADSSGHCWICGTDVPRQERTVLAPPVLAPDSFREYVAHAVSQAFAHDTMPCVGVEVTR